MFMYRIMGRVLVPSSLRVISLQVRSVTFMFRIMIPLIRFIRTIRFWSIIPKLILIPLRIIFIFLTYDYS